MAMASASTTTNGAQSSMYVPFNDRADTIIKYEALAGDEVSGMVIGGSDWFEFYVRPDTYDTQLLEQINANLHEFYERTPLPSLEELGLHKKGMPCAVRFELDKRYYRAVLIDTEYNIVRFIDYGNVQMCAANDLKPMSQQYIDILGASIIPCKLTKAQDNQLPSFVNDHSKVHMTILNSSGPLYEVAVKILPTTARDRPSSITAAASANAANASANGASASASNGDGRGGGGGGGGLSTMSRRPGADIDDEEDMAKKARPTPLPSNRPHLPPRQGMAPRGGYLESRFNVNNQVGFVNAVYATCAGIHLPGYPARSFEINTQQSAFANGPLMVEDLRRIFREKEPMRFSAKMEQPFVTSEMRYSRLVAEDDDENKKKKKPPPPPLDDDGRWLVTDFKFEDHYVPNGNGGGNLTTVTTPPKVLITHAVITFVGETACNLYVRTTGEMIWAPKGVFPHHVALSERALNDTPHVEVGRSVIVRAGPTEQLADFSLDVTWMARAVEFVGTVSEERGYMYLVRENYSVIITEGNVGFGYVYIPNQCVEAEGYPLEEWYGTRVYYRCCVDVPDRSEDSATGRYGTRWRGLRARLDPDDTKGAYKYAGIFRPTPFADMGDMPSTTFRTMDKEATAKKKWVNTTELDNDFAELPPETVQEMRMLGVDRIGTERPISVIPIPDPVVMVRDNLLNELIATGEMGGNNSTATTATAAISTPNASIDSARMEREMQERREAEHLERVRLSVMATLRGDQNQSTTANRDQSSAAIGGEERPIETAPTSSMLQDPWAMTQASPAIIIRSSPTSVPNQSPIAPAAPVDNGAHGGARMKTYYHQQMIQHQSQPIPTDLLSSTVEIDFGPTETVDISDEWHSMIPQHQQQRPINPTPAAADQRRQQGNRGAEANAASRRRNTNPINQGAQTETTMADYQNTGSAADNLPRNTMMGGGRVGMSAQAAAMRLEAINDMRRITDDDMDRLMQESMTWPNELRKRLFELCRAAMESMM